MLNNVTNLAEKMNAPVVKQGMKVAKNSRDKNKTKVDMETFCKPNKLHCETIVTNAAKTVAGVMYACIPLELMDVDRSYQRKVVPSHITALKANWNDEAAGALIVNHRDDRFYVVDGQNRMFAAHALGKKMLHCQIHDGKTQQEEAHIFMCQDRIKRKLNGSDIIKSGAVAGDEACVAVRDVCAEYGVNPCREYPSEMGALAGTYQAIKIVRTQGADRLRQVFGLIQACGWHMMPKAYSSAILSAFRNLFALYEADAVERAVVKVCRNTTPTETIINAQAAHKTARGPVNALTTYLGTFIEK